jgi:hypothetical protein
MGMQCLQKPEEGITDSCELFGSCWEPNPGPLQWQYALLATESSFQRQLLIFKGPFIVFFFSFHFLLGI